MNHPRQPHPPGDSRPPRPTNKLKPRLILVGALVGLTALTVVTAAAAVLLGRADATGAALTAGSAGLILFSVIAPLLTIALLVAVALWAVRRKIRAAQDWPATRGVVLTSEVVDPGGESGWRARVVYRYEVGGRVYENSRIAVAVEHGNQSLHAQERLAARFPAGAEVPVYYDPRNPSDAALVKGDPNSPTPSWF